MKKIFFTIWLIFISSNSYSDTVASALIESGFDWKNFQPKMKPEIPILDNEPAILGTEEIQKVTEEHNKAESNDTKKILKKQIVRLKEIDYFILKKDEEAFEEEGPIKIFSHKLDKYNSQSGDDYKYELGLFEGLTPFRVFSEAELNLCKYEYDQLIPILGTPSKTRDLAHPAYKVSKIFTQQELKASWELEGFHIEFDCSALINFQDFYDPSPQIEFTNNILNKKIQAALNYFGFEAGPVDGKIGNKTLEAISNYNDCIGYISVSSLDERRYEFLINSFDDLSTEKTIADCSSLELKLPRQFMAYVTSLTFLSPDRSSKIQPITWLQCLKESRRTQNFEYDTDETEATNKILIYGIDYASSSVFAENKTTLSEDAKITDGAISWEINRQPKAEFFDTLNMVFAIDRMSGKHFQKSEFFKNSKLVARISSKGACSKVEVAKQKF